MNLTDQQLWTLEQLGIPVWRQRQVVRSDLTQENPEADAAAVVCHAPLLLCAAEPNNSAEQQLLANICKVIDVSFEQCQPPMLLKLNVDAELPRQILILGDLPSALDASLTKRCTKLPSLNDVIHDPALKAVICAAICQRQQQAS